MELLNLRYKCTVRIGKAFIMWWIKAFALKNICQQLQIRPITVWKYDSCRSSFRLPSDWYRLHNPTFNRFVGCTIWNSWWTYALQRQPFLDNYQLACGLYGVLSIFIVEKRSFLSVVEQMAFRKKPKLSIRLICNW